MINAVLLVFSLIISLPICHLLRLSTPLRMSMQNNEQDRLDISRRKMEHIICSNPSEFDATLSKALEVDKPCFVLFTGAKNKETGKSWCPDCVAAEPIISDKFGSLDVTLIECPVVREEYRQPTYSYRVHDKIKLKCVPTLHKFNNKGLSIASLDDNQSQVPDLIDELISA